MAKLLKLFVDVDRNIHEAMEHAKILKFRPTSFSLLGQDFLVNRIGCEETLGHKNGAKSRRCHLDGCECLLLLDATRGSFCFFAKHRAR